MRVETRWGHAVRGLAFVMVLGSVLLLAGCPIWFVTAPDVTNLVRGKAQARLEAAGLALGAITREAHATLPAGTVIAQTPAAGSYVMRGGKVNLVVSLGEGCVDDGAAPTPVLRPLTAAQAEALGAYCRKLKVSSGGNDPVPMAWSMINQACQDRALVLQYAIATASFPLPEEPPVMNGDTLTVEQVQAAAAQPGIDAATINVTGPLITYQRLVNPAGAEIPGDPLVNYWPYHHGVVLNVEGEFRVMDLSVQDAPLPIQEWLRGFISEDIPCSLRTDEDHLLVWSYWLSAMSNWEPEARPLCPASYTLTPLFRFRWDQEVLAEVVVSGPSTMETQSGGFQSIMQDNYGFVPSAGDIPNYTSRYDAQTEAELCDWVDLKYCDN